MSVWVLRSVKAWYMGVKSATYTLTASPYCARASLSLSAHGPDGRMREYHGRDHVVFQAPLGLAAEQPVAQAPAGGDRHGRQSGSAGDIADGVDAGDIGVLKRVGGRRSRPSSSATPAALRSRPATFAERPIAQSTQSKPANSRPSAADQGPCRPSCSRTAAGTTSRVDDHALRVHLAHQGLAEHRVEMGQQVILADEQLHLAARAPGTRRPARRRHSRCRRPRRAAAGARARKSRRR